MQKSLPLQSSLIRVTKKVSLLLELLTLITTSPELYGTPPPPYDDALLDSPPPYLTTESNAHSRVEAGNFAPSRRYELNGQHRDDPTINIMDGTLDWGTTAGFKSVGNKNKKAAKKAAQARWAGSDNEDENKGAEGADGGGGGEDGEGGGAGGNGDGGDGAGGGDGGGDDWDFGGGKKNKKKGKKAKQEEEEKKRQEEEEAAKKKEEEEAAAANGHPANPLSWPDEANPDDEWGGFTTSKSKKKGKKGNKVILYAFLRSRS